MAQGTAVNWLSTSSMGHVGWALMRLCSAVVTLNLLLNLPLTAAQGMDYTTYFLPEQLGALQALLGAWNESTPNPSSNLAGWSSTNIYPCSQEYDDHAPNWRGVQCLDAHMNCMQVTANTSDCEGYITGLTLNNASIHGVLPPEIGKITTLTTLELTGNPDLTGPLPYAINEPYLYTLDLHDNGFNGTLPDMPGLFTLLSIDLSGNQFVGQFLPHIYTWTYPQILKLARNHFNDTVPTNAFVKMTQLEALDLSVNDLTGNVPDLSACKNLQSLVLSNNSFSGPLPDLTMASALQTLKLAHTNLTGTFPFSSFVNGSNTLSVLDLSGTHLTGSVTNWNGSDLISLQELYLDNNRISGTLDVSALINSGLVRNETSMNGSQPGLSTLSMMNTDITDVIYTESNIGGITTHVRLQGSPYCRKKTADDGTRCFCQQFCSNQGSLSNKKVIIIAAATSSVSILLIIIAFAGAYLYRTRRYKQYLLLQVQQKFEEFDVKPTIFHFNELRAATRDFHPEMKLGEGGYGAVYKGVLPNNSTVAVKQLFVKNSQGIDEFLNEVVLITGMKHRNLVNLKGCCLREHQRLLVYEYVDNYDIDQVLLRGEHKTSLSWATRQNICLGVARGLHYLHSLAQPRIIHRDIKASNILLDKSFEPKIADFGLALLFPDEKSHIMTVHVAGTKGYLAPEYASLGQLSEKVDVFSFGVLCLEVLSGRRNIEESLPLNEVYLSNWAWKLHSEGKLMDLVDPTLKLQDEEKADVQRLFNIALLCSQDSADERPTMARVVAMLQHDMESEVVALNSRKKEQHIDTMRLLAFGKEEELPAVAEDEAETSSLNPQGGSVKQGSMQNEGSELITVNKLIQLSEMKAR